MMSSTARGGPSKLETQTPGEHTESPPTPADPRSDDVARIHHLLREDLLEEKDIFTILHRTRDKRKSGEYRFDRYETM